MADEKENLNSARRKSEKPPQKVIHTPKSNLSPPKQPQQKLGQKTETPNKKLPFAKPATEKEPTIPKTQYVRLAADFDNYRKNMQQEQLNWITQANKNLLCELIPIIDDIELALTQQTSQKEVQGLQLIYTKLCHFLERQNLEVMPVAVGDKFDPDRHEAFGTLPTQDETKKKTIQQIINKGYILNKQIIRFAKVIVST